MKYYAIPVAALLLGGCASNQYHSAHRGADGSSRAWITPLDPIGETASGAAPAGERGASAQMQAGSDVQISEMQEIPLFREQVQVGKREVPAGGVLLRKIVQTENASEPVELRREELVIERVRAGEERSEFNGNAQPFTDREVVIELNREIPTVDKSVVVTEVVRANKVANTRQVEVPATIRREEIEIDRAQAEAAGGAPAAEAGQARSDVAAPAQPTREQRDSAELQLHRERLQVGTRQVPNGRVRLSKNVVTEEVRRPVELRTEDVKIERQVVEGGNTDAQAAFNQEEIYIPLTEEIPVIQKEIRLSEIVRAGKRIETERANIQEQIRHERVEIVGNERQNPRADSEASGGPADAESGAASQQMENNQPAQREMPQPE